MSAPSDLPDLRHAARRPLDLGRGDGLHGVEDEQRGLDGVQMAENRGQVGLGGQVQMVVDRPDPVGAQPHLARGLLGGDVKRAVLVARGLGGDVQQQRRLADAGLARDEHHGTRHEAAAEHPVQLTDAGGPGGGLPAVDLADGERGGADPAGCGGPHGGGAAELLDRPPRLAFGAAAEPLGGRPAAFGAAVGRPVLRGFRTGSHGATV